MENLKKAHKSVILIGIAIMAGLFVFPAIVEIIKIHNSPFKGFFSGWDSYMLKYLFLGITIAEYPLIKVITDNILGKKQTDNTGDNTEIASPLKIQKLVSLSIIKYLLFESIAVFGLILFLIAGKTTDFYLFMFLSLTFFILDFPRYSQWEEWIKTGNRNKF